MTARVWNTLPGPEGVVLRGHTQVVAGAEKVKRAIIKAHDKARTSFAEGQ